MKIKKGEQFNGYIVRLQNNSSISQDDTIYFGKQSLSLSFDKYEVKTVVYDGTNLKEIAEMLI